MSAIYNDGNLPYGARLIYITGSGGSNIGAYVAENFSSDTPVIKIKRSNELGEPNGQVAIKDFKTCTATLQLASTSSTVPVSGNTFGTTIGASSVTFYIDNVTQPEAQLQDKKVNITATEKIN